MASIVNDLLLLTRLDREVRERREDVDLTRQLLDAFDDARTAAPDHHWALSVPETPVLVRGDEEQLRRMVGNLVANVHRAGPGDRPGSSPVTRRVARHCASAPGDTTVTVTLPPEPALPNG
ncbi:HAMP domain-containing histidine kinase [Leekyejoonella antrihumi]|uniref:HAMP domain-containing histidine kinase n=1 Tax=Leekyejoonella antrihumi TaxID=1660198 RepID=A0A563DUI4_9MICO|nr:HAMP domain-containing histidine kinase [Leekyejoonella antrihumi]TWP33836.1 HAMP domain-containing histidine kinase [Leekyejoonella antrihumi]